MKLFAAFAVFSCVLGCLPLYGQPPGNATFGLPATASALVTKEYPAKRIRDIFGADAENPKNALEASGIFFPPGSFAHWATEPERLVVCNTRESLEFLDTFDPPPPEGFDPTSWSGADHARTQADLVGTYVYSGRLCLELELTPDGGFHLSSRGHMEPEKTVYQGTWQLRNGWVVLDSGKAADGRENPFRYFYAEFRRPGYALAPFVGLQPDQKTPRLIVYLRSVAVNASPHVP